MQDVGMETVKRFLLLWIPIFLIISPLSAEENAQLARPPVNNAPPPDVASPVQNAVIEGVQLSSEPSKEPGENVVTCYFIFRDKPSSYFYEVKRGAKKLVFEFNDTQKGSSPIPSSAQAPILGFEMEQKKVDINKEVKGLTPEWHDLISITFDLSAVPQISVSDEYNVISFTYKWSNDPAKTTKYIVKESKTNWGILGSLLGVGAVGAGVAIWYVLKPPPPPPVPTPLDTSDLPSHLQFRFF